MERKASTATPTKATATTATTSTADGEPMNIVIDNGQDDGVESQAKRAKATGSCSKKRNNL